jgi:hypothetical protein
MFYVVLLVTSLIAGTAVWTVVDRGHPAIPLPADLHNLTQPTAEQIVRMRTHTRLNDAVAHGVFGAVLGIAAAIVFAWRSTVAIKIVCLVVGLGLGIAGGMGMSWFGHYLNDWLPITWDTLIRSSVIWMLMTLCLGLVAAVVAAIATGFNRTTSHLFTGGIVGGIVSAVVYALVTGTFLQNENANAVLPTGYYSRPLLYCITIFFILASIAYQRSVSAQPAAVAPVPAVD